MEEQNQHFSNLMAAAFHTTQPVNSREELLKLTQQGLVHHHGYGSCMQALCKLGFRVSAAVPPPAIGVPKVRTFGNGAAACPSFLQGQLQTLFLLSFQSAIPASTFSGALGDMKVCTPRSLVGYVGLCGLCVGLLCLVMISQSHFSVCAAQYCEPHHGVPEKSRDR